MLDVNKFGVALLHICAYTRTHTHVHMGNAVVVVANFTFGNCS